jgi:solute carrier family 25 thiamine pyrophosphate transporter 19
MHHRFQRHDESSAFYNSLILFAQGFTCHGLLDCLWLTVRGETVAGLYKGLWPSLLKAGVTTALHFCLYEQACQAIAAMHR